MISKIKPPPKIDTDVTDSSRIRMYVHKSYKEILDNFKNKYALEYPGVFRYPYNLYTVLEDAYVGGTFITTVRVNDAKVEGVFKYIDISGLRTYDIPLECFSTTNTNEAFSELLRSFDDK